MNKQRKNNLHFIRGGNNISHTKRCRRCGKDDIPNTEDAMIKHYLECCHEQPKLTQKLESFLQ